MSVMKNDAGNEDSDDDRDDWTFGANFWDEKLRGYEILGQNLRNSLASIKELERFLRECVHSEEHYMKQLNKNTNLIEKFLTDSTLSPVWFDLIRTCNETAQCAHFRSMTRLNELAKDIHVYYQEMRKKKRKIKENEQKTVQLIEQFSAHKQVMVRAKEIYHQQVIELDKLKQTFELSPQVEKLEKKVASSIEEYKQSIDKYNVLNKEFEIKFAESCRVFHQNEETHLSRMRIFLFSYMEIVTNLNQARLNAHLVCQSKFESKYTVDYLMREFVRAKSTGQQRLTDAEFVEYASTTEVAAATTPTTTMTPSPGHIYSNSQAELSASTASSTTPKKTQFEASGLSESVRRRSDSRFSLFNLDFLGRNKSKKLYNTVRGESTAKSNQQSMSINANSYKLNSALQETFDQQLIQLNNLENEASRAASISGVNKSSEQVDFSIGSPFLLSNSELDSKFESKFAGSLKTATSLENFYGDTSYENNNNEINNNQLSYSNNNMKMLDGIINVDEFDDQLNQFSSFEDLEIEAKIAKNKETWNTDMSNFYDSNQSLENAEKNLKDDVNLSTPLNNASNAKYSTSVDTENYFLNDEDRTTVTSEEEEEEEDEDNNEATSSDGSTSSDDSDAPKRILVKINPLSQSVDRSVTPDILNQITKSLHLNIPFSSSPSRRDLHRHPKALKQTQLASNLSTPPPLPPLPTPQLQQKVKEKKAAMFIQQESFETPVVAPNTTSQIRSEPILISSNKLVKQNSFRHIIDSSRNNNKKMLSTIDNSLMMIKTQQQQQQTPLLSNSYGSIRSLKRLNLKIPGEEEMQF